MDVYATDLEVYIGRVRDGGRPVCYLYIVANTHTDNNNAFDYLSNGYFSNLIQNRIIPPFPPLNYLCICHCYFSGVFLIYHINCFIISTDITDSAHNCGVDNNNHVRYIIDYYNLFEIKIRHIFVYVIYDVVVYTPWYAKGHFLF